MNDAVRDYILSMIAQDNPTLSALEHRYDGRTDIQPAIGPAVGKLLGLLIRLSHATQILELGTRLGYSTVWLAQAMEATHGLVTSVELNHDLVVETERSVDLAGLSGRVRLMEGDAARAAYELPGPFDLILQDSDTSLYPGLFERLVRITRVGGILAAGDTLFRPLGSPAKFADPVHRYNQLATADPRLYTTILPIGNGLTVSLKISDGSPFVD